jgi:hypothetical protein
MQVVREHHFCLLKILTSDDRLIVDPARSISPARCGVDRLALDSPTPNLNSKVQLIGHNREYNTNVSSNTEFSEFGKLLA